VLPKADLNNLHKIISAPASIRALITGSSAEVSQGYIFICGLRSEVLRAINTNTNVFWKMTPFSLVEMYLTDVSAVPGASIVKEEE
jgi:hypothetical protein